MVKPVQDRVLRVTAVFATLLAQKKLDVNTVGVLVEAMMPDWIEVELEKEVKVAIQASIMLETLQDSS